MNSYKLLSFDIWDTIIRRKCHPDEIKLYTARWIYLSYYPILHENYRDYYTIFQERCAIEGEIGKAAKELGHDDEYSLSQVYLNLLKKILSEEADYEQIALSLVELELNREKYSAYLDPQILNKTKSILADKVVFISDFYTNKAFIESMLEHVKAPFNFNTGYVSCDFSLNKRSGKLFKHVHSEHAITPSEHIHIGDSIHADVNPPNALGMSCIHYINPDEEDKREQLKVQFLERMKSKSISYKAPVSLPYRQELSEDQQKLRSIGSQHALIFFCFVMEIIEKALISGHERVYYMTREGEFFKRIHDKIAECGLYGVELPKAELIEVSRIATFAPSIREVSLQEFMRIWNQYSTQSMKAFFSSLDVKLENYSNWIQKHGIQPEEEIQYPWLDSRVIQLFEDAGFNEALSQELFDKKAIAMEYLKQIGITEEVDKLFVVDIGWRGTIQDNLSYLLPHIQVEGFYLGLYDFINKQPENTSKSSFLSTHEMNKYLRFVAPVEMLTNSNSGSVRHYRFDPENNCYLAEKVHEPAEDQVYEKYTLHFQDGVIEGGEDIVRFAEMHSLLSSDLKEQALKLLSELINQPPRLVAKAFFELEHNETFGVGKFMIKKAKFPWKQAFLGIMSKRRMRIFKLKLEESSWPQGLLVYYNFAALNTLYNRLTGSHYEQKEMEQSSNNNNLDHIKLQEEIQAQNIMLEERYAAMMEMEQMIVERDQTILHQDRLIQELKKKLEEKMR